MTFRIPLPPPIDSPPQLQQLLRSGLLGVAERRAAAERVAELGAGAELDEDVVFISSTLLPDPVKQPPPQSAAGDALARVRHATSLHVQRFLSRARRSEAAGVEGIAGWLSRHPVGEPPSRKEAGALAPRLPREGGPASTLLRRLSAPVAAAAGEDAPLGGPGERQPLQQRPHRAAAVCGSTAAASVVDLLSQPDEGGGASPPQQSAPPSKGALASAPPSSLRAPAAAATRPRTISDIRRYTMAVATPPQTEAAAAAAAAAASALPRTGAPLPRRPLDAYLVWRRAPPVPSGVLRGKPRALWGQPRGGRTPDAAVVTLPSDDEEEGAEEAGAPEGGEAREEGAALPDAAAARGEAEQ